MRRVVLAAAALLVLSAMVPGVALGVVTGEPDLDVTVAENRVAPGETTALTLAVSNTGEIISGSARAPNAEQRVMTARGLTVEALDEGPIDVQTGVVSLGSLPDGGVASPQVQVSVDEDADPGTYRLPVRVEYTYTRTIGEQADEVHNTETVEDVLYATVRVTESADVEVVDVESDVAVGGSGTVSLTYQNTGDAPATDGSVTVQSGNAGLTFSGSPSASASLGTLAPDETRTVTLGASVAAGAASRSFALTSTVTYEDDGVPQEQTLTSGVTPGSDGRFVVENSETTVSPGHTGQVTVAVRNTGDAVTDATVSIQSANAVLTFGGSPDARGFAAEWGAGETREFTFEASLAPGAEQRSFPVDVSVAFENDQGQTAQSATVTTGIEPAGDQSFSLSNVESSLRVGEDGTLSGTLTNDGPAGVDNAVLVLQPAGPNVDLLETEYAVGSLGAGESVDFAYDVGISGAASDGPKQFQFQLRYEDGTGETRQSDPLYTRQTVEADRDQFDVEGLETTFAPGDSGQLSIQVTNNGDEPVTDISAKLFVDDPVSSSDDEAFIAELGPGETKEMTFGASVAGSALEKTYPVSVDFQYTDADGDTRLTDTYRVPVTVGEPEDGGGGLFSLGWLVDLFGGLLTLVGQVAAAGDAALASVGALGFAPGRDAGLVAVAGAAIVAGRR